MAHLPVMRTSYIVNQLMKHGADEIVEGQEGKGIPGRPQTHLQLVTKRNRVDYQSIIGSSYDAQTKAWGKRGWP